jgi:DNA (cytosine-5)-methyltransferase 1
VPSSGGSSHQFLLFIEGDKTYIRAINPAEAMTLMSIPETYRMPSDPIEALSLCGDGVVVPVVRFLAERVLEPLLAAAEETAWSRSAA